MSYPWLAYAGERLARNAEGGRRAHALLVSGPRGLGKVDLALREAAALLCLSGERPACGRCRSCQLMAGGAHPDFRQVTFEVNDKGQLRSVIAVDQIRDLIASLQLTNSLSALKVAVIHPAEAMNRNAANALLKTLEEPAGDLVLMLVASDDARLPATVRSRCQVIGVRQPDADDARADGRASTRRPPRSRWRRAPAARCWRPRCYSPVLWTATGRPGRCCRGWKATRTQSAKPSRRCRNSSPPSAGAGFPSLPPRVSGRRRPMRRPAGITRRACCGCSRWPTATAAWRRHRCATTYFCAIGC